MKRTLPLKVLTNHHCFAIKGANGLATEQYLPGTCTNTYVYFNVVKGAGDFVTEAKCIEGSFTSDFLADLASFSIEGMIPENTNPIELLELPDAAGRKAFIVHYPAKAENFHQFNKLGLSLPVATITEQDCKIIGRFPPNEWKQ